MKILVTGSNGQLGSEIRDLAPAFPAYTFIFTDIGELDITDETKLRHFFQAEKPGAVINCAAYTAVDKAEDEPEAAHLINGTATGILARQATESGAFLVHISTDYVFNGLSCRPYSEEDEPNPVSIYARSKWVGEQEALSAGSATLIIRTSWLYSSYGNNFVKTILKHAKEKGSLRVVYDQVGSPTYAFDLASEILRILPEAKSRGGTAIYHYANEGVASWYDFAKAIVELKGIPCTIEAIATAAYPTRAARPYYSVLDKDKIKRTFGTTLPYWRDSLAMCLKKLELR